MTMTEPDRRRRKLTAREAAARFGVSERTIRRTMAEPRASFEARGQARRVQAAALRAEGLKWAVVGERMGVSADAARRLAARAPKPADD